MFESQGDSELSADSSNAAEDDMAAPAKKNKNGLLVHTTGVVTLRELDLPKSLPVQGRHHEAKALFESKLPFK